MCSCSRFFLLALFLSVQSVLSAPLTLSQAVVRDGETFTMQLKRLDLRGDHFELLVQNAAGLVWVTRPGPYGPKFALTSTVHATKHLNNLSAPPVLHPSLQPRSRQLLGIEVCSSFRLS